MFKLAKTFSTNRLFWIFLLLLGIGLEICGLYFQYGLNLDPCVNCVYERAFFLSFIIAGFLGFISPTFILTRIFAILIFLMGSIGGIIIAITHIQDVYFPKLGQTCQLKANFPSFLPLDEIAEWIFSPTGACIKLDWSLLGLGMPEWILITFSCGAVAALVMLIAEFIVSKKNDYIKLYR